MKRTLTLLLMINILTIGMIKAQSVSIKETDKGLFSLNVPSQVFFKNNEYKRKIAYGYTLGGVRLIPNFEYQPLENLSLSAGINMLRYWGANEYGQYNFVNVPYYSDTNTQKQLHWKPYFRVNWQVNDNLNFIMGNISNENCHYLPVPLYNRELLYSSDGEEGLQLLYKGKHWTNDLWVNWQNFNFFNDTDRESFDVGVSGMLSTKKLLPQIPVGLLLNYSFIWHHNGGELDTISTLDLDHWSNGRIGLSVFADHLDRFDSRLVLSVDYLFAKDMKNNTWAFKSGHAWFPSVSYENYKYQLTLGYYDSKDMMTFYATNYFNNLAQRDLNVTYPHNQMLYGSLSYNINLNKKTNKHFSDYMMTVVGEFFYKLDESNSVEKESKSMSFGLGVIFTAKNKVRIKQFNDIN